MSWIMVDVETTGPCPGLFSMYEIGAVIVRPGLETRFHAQLRPDAPRFDAGAMSVCQYTKEQLYAFEPAHYGMKEFNTWLLETSVGRPMFISDNNGFDWQFVNYYFHRYLEHNPFGFSSANLGSLYKGMESDMFAGFKHLRKTVHDHNPVNDALGNAEALLWMVDNGLKMSLK